MQSFGQFLKVAGLELDFATLNGECCKALANLKAPRLVMGECQLMDQGAALAESIRLGNGPRELQVFSVDNLLFVNTLQSKKFPSPS